MIQQQQQQQRSDDYDRLVGKWVFASVEAAKGLAKTAKYDKWTIEFSIENGILTRKVDQKVKVLGLGFPELGVLEERFSLVEVSSKDEDSDTSPSTVFEHKFKARNGRSMIPTHYRRRIISRGNGVFEESTRSRIAYQYPRITEQAGEYYRMEIDDFNQTMIYKQSTLYGGVVRFVKAA